MFSCFMTEIVLNRMDQPRRPETVRDLLRAARQDAAERDCVDRLFEMIYDELHGLAEIMVSRERTGHTLRPTDLVHEDAHQARL